MQAPAYRPPHDTTHCMLRSRGVWVAYTTNSGLCKLPRTEQTLLSHNASAFPCRHKTSEWQLFHCPSLQTPTAPQQTTHAPKATTTNTNVRCTNATLATLINCSLRIVLKAPNAGCSPAEHTHADAKLFAPKGGLLMFMYTQLFATLIALALL